jgi:hypothetical protein
VDMAKAGDVAASIEHPRYGGRSPAFHCHCN